MRNRRGSIEIFPDSNSPTGFSTSRGMPVSVKTLEGKNSYHRIVIPNNSLYNGMRIRGIARSMARGAPYFYVAEGDDGSFLAQYYKDAEVEE